MKMRKAILLGALLAAVFALCSLRGPVGRRYGRNLVL